MTELTVSLEQARRFLIRRQHYLPYGDPFTGADAVAKAVRQLEAVQIDPLCIFERNHHQVLYNRVLGYQPEWLDQLLYQQRGAFEYYCNALCVLPMGDFPWFIPAMRRQEAEVTVGVDPEMRQVIDEVLQHIRQEGEASSKDFDSGRKIYGWWESSGNNPRTPAEQQISDAGVMILHPAGKPPRTKAEKQALDYLHLAGRVLISNRNGNQRSYDLPERIVPPELMASQPDAAASQRFLMLKYLRAYGLSHLGQPGFRFGWSHGPKAEKRRLLLELVSEGLVDQVRIEGLRRSYFCPAELRAELQMTDPLPVGEAAVILAPLDNLLWDRDRLDDLWGFNYRWEVYTPVAKRRYGHYVVPVLHGEWLVGRIELRGDRAENQLRVDNLWFEPGREGALPAVRRAVELEAAYLGLPRVCWR